MRPRREVVAAASAANAHDFIMALPDGYDTVIGERGAQLSGGQRQRIAIARALLRDAPILVLDEALSSVDAENEAVIQQALDRLMTGRTTLILAHRLSSVIGADRILVLEDGAVVQAGRHAELIAVDGPYRDLMGPQLAEHDDVLIDEQLPTPGGLRVVETAGPRRTPWSDRCRTTPPKSAGPRPSAPCCGFVGPWRGQLVVTVLCGILRVVAFIGVGVLGALLLGAVRSARADPERLILALLLTAPLAGLLHWLESWLAHAMAYAAAGRDAHRSVPQAGCAGAGLSAAAALRRPGGAGDAGRRDRGIFLRPYHRAGDRRRAGAGRRAGGRWRGSAGRWRWSWRRS